MHDPFQNYDSWKTASPEDDQPEGYELTAKMSRRLVVYSKQIEKARIRLQEMRANEKMPTIEELPKEFNLPVGNFSWVPDEAGDWIPWQCDEEECEAPGKWHKKGYLFAIERKDGKLSFEIREVDEDGDWDLTESWHEGDPQAGIDSLLLANLQNEDEYFLGWADYWLYCAEHGEDPLEQCISGRKSYGDEDWFYFCLDGVRDMLRYTKKK